MGSCSDSHICQCLSRLATVRRNSPVIVSGDRQRTGQQFVDGVLRLARGLLELGLRPGDVVAISALNSDEYLEWLLAVAFVGGIAAPLNYRWSLQEAKSAIEIVTPKMLLTDGNSKDWLLNLQFDSVNGVGWRVLMDAPRKSGFIENTLTTAMLKKHSMESPLPSYSWAPNGAALICFTSGTTGKPKGVTISHTSLVVQSLAKLAIVGYNEDDVYLHTAPLCHIGGISSAMAMLMVGGLHVFMPKFEAKSALQAIENHRVTSLITVPAIMADLLSIIRKIKTDEQVETVKKILNGGGELSTDVMKGAVKCFPRARLLSAYGMTETCSSLSFKTIYDPLSDNFGYQSHVVGSEQSQSAHQLVGVCVGKPAPHVEMMISSGNSDEAGRILTRGPHVMLGYWGQVPTRGSNPNNKDWHDTGDMGWMDDYGNIWLVGRSNGRIKSGGENVYPEEIEAILSKHPGISGVVIVGIPDPRLTEMVVACVQLNENWQWVDSVSGNSAMHNDRHLSSHILQHFCRGKKLTGYKIPRAWIIWKTTFPLTSTGKLKRDLVKREANSHMKLLPSSL